MRISRDRLVQLVLILVLSSGCSTRAAQAQGSVTLFRCAGGQSFTVERDDRSAIVIYSGVRHELPRRSSSIGERYATGDATLIIDGDMAAFVTRSVMNLDFCRASGASTK